MWLSEGLLSWCCAAIFFSCRYILGMFLSSVEKPREVAMASDVGFTTITYFFAWGNITSMFILLQTRLPVYLAHKNEGTSAKNILHYFQVVYHKYRSIHIKTASVQKNNITMPYFIYIFDRKSRPGNSRSLTTDRVGIWTITIRFFCLTLPPSRNNIYFVHHM